LKRQRRSLTPAVLLVPVEIERTDGAHSANVKIVEMPPGQHPSTLAVRERHSVLRCIFVQHAHMTRGSRFASQLADFAW
jgi:hypothetical protein